MPNRKRATEPVVFSPAEIRTAAAGITAMVPGDYQTAQSILMLALTFCQSAEDQRPRPLRRAPTSG